MAAVLWSAIPFAKRCAAMHEIKLGEQDLLAYLKPDSFVGAAVYLLVFILLAMVLSRLLRVALHTRLTGTEHIDRTTISFLQQMGTALIWVVMLILYAHLIPVLRAMGTALLAGASIASVVIGLAAQSTLGNLVAGVAITLYRPFRLGDTLQVTAPTGTETGTVELISLGYTTLKTGDGRLVVLPNSVAASSVAINLGDRYNPAPLPVTIRVARQADVETARQLALDTAAEVVEQSSVLGCLLTKVNASGALLELRVRVAAGGDRDALHSKLIAALARSFVAKGLDAPGAERTGFS
jgi:small conductance mechanosensitive channel